MDINWLLVILESFPFHNALEALAQPRKVRGSSLTHQPTSSSLVFRPDAVLLLLRKAYKDNHLGNVCRLVARLLRKLSGCSPEAAGPSLESTLLSGSEDMAAKGESAAQAAVTDYSHLFGEEFKLSDEDLSDLANVNILDVAAVEEGLLHILFACASQPLLCRRLADTKTDLLPALPLIQAMLPALRPVVVGASNPDQVDDTFWQWQIPLVQHAVTQIAAVSLSSSYRPLLDACAGYFSSYSLAHGKAACVLIDLCSGPLAPWIPMVIAKVDLTIELLEDLLGVIQGGQHVIVYARAALIYMMLALSGHMDDLLTKFKAVKHNLLFLIEMLEPFLVPAITPVKNTIAFGDVSAIFMEKQEKTCAIALDLLRTAVQRPAVLPALEIEWRRGIVAPSVLLSILAPHVPLPPGIDLRKSSVNKGAHHEASVLSLVSSDQQITAVAKFGAVEEDADGRPDIVDGNLKVDATEDANLLFAPAELKSITLRNFSTPFEGNLPDSQSFGGRFVEAEQALCRALFQLKEDREDAKEVLREALTRSSESTQLHPDLANVRESVLQVLARLNSIRSKFDAFTEVAVQEAKELEEAEIEVELLREEQKLQEGSKTNIQPAQMASTLASSAAKDAHQRLQELKAQIRNMECSETRAEIVARRERQRIARRTRQLTLEEAALREMELLQDLDRERVAEAEREIERQRSLERERAKTRELRYNLDLEAEKRAQRDYQRELEQRESGLRSSRREFSTSTPSSRPRERYREREGGRPAQEGGLRPSSSGSGMRESGVTPPATPTASSLAAPVTSIGTVSSSPTIVITSSRAYPGQSSAFLHARERTDDRGYEDNFDGSRDSGDASSIGDPETGSAMDMMTTGSFNAAHRQGSRSSKPRQIVERRERDGRREGKWERKQG